MEPLGKRARRRLERASQRAGGGKAPPAAATSSGVTFLVRLKCEIAYDGAAHEGFQTQPHGRTVQDELENGMLLYRVRGELNTLEDDGSYVMGIVNSLRQAWAGSASQPAAQQEPGPTVLLNSPHTFGMYGSLLRSHVHLHVTPLVPNRSCFS